MGMPNTKFGKELPNNELQEGNVPSTPILTPKTVKTTEMDPRSPSLHIARTPLELLSSTAEKSETEDTSIQNKHLILGIDPRSPTTDFKRTPIVLSTIEGDLPRKLHNKNLDKVRLSEIHTTPTHAGEKKTIVPPKLLESSPVKPKPDLYKRRSLVGLLETNIDYTETDLDKVLQDKNGEKSNLEAQDDHIQSGENTTTNTQLSNKDTVDEINKENKGDIENIENVDTGVEIDKLYIPNETKSEPSSPFTSITHFKEVKSEPITPPCVDLTADIQELDKKLTNLIYEDNDLVVCPRIVRLKENTERSPLRNCNGNEPRAKYALKLKVNDKPRRSEYAVSKIPVFKEKKICQLKGGIQCENTPPKNMDMKKIRHRKSDWDTKDTTLYL